MALFSITSEVNSTSSTLTELYNFLCDFKNFESILPSDKVDNFSYEGDKCVFTIKGITQLSITLSEKDPYNYIIFKSEGLARFNFLLKVHFLGEAGKPGDCRIDLSGDLNPFIKTMAERPLKDLVNTMSLKLSQLTV